MLMLCKLQVIKSFNITVTALQGVVPFVNNNETIIFEPLFKLFNDVAANSFIFYDAFCELIFPGLKLRF